MKLPASIKAPDVKAPRVRLKAKRLINNEFYNSFKKKHPQFKDVPNATLKKIIITFNTELWNTAINTRDGVEMPEGLGYVFIATCQPSTKRNNINIKASLASGVAVKHRNLMSDNYLAKIFYTNFANKYKFMHRELWAFTGCRDFKRSVSKTYPEKWMNYIQVTNGEKVRDRYKKAKRIELIIKKQALNSLATDNYNEFQID
jgi:hypothetical protein